MSAQLFFCLFFPKVTGQESDTDSDQEMDGKPEYEFPSQDELIRDAFAGDDVEMEFEKEKMKILDDENPEPEKPVLLPGWGQWASVQKKKGLPSWMVKEHEDAKMKREAALKKRKDAHLKNVIISEKTVKKVSFFPSSRHIVNISRMIKNENDLFDLNTSKYTRFMCHLN